MEVDWIADRYWARKSKRSPLVAKVARQAMRNRAIADYYWLLRQERVDREADPRLEARLDTWLRPRPVARPDARPGKGRRVG